MRNREEIKERLEKAKELNDYFERILLGFALEFYDKGVDRGFANLLVEYEDLLETLKLKEHKDCTAIEICEKVIIFTRWLLKIRGS